MILPNGPAVPVAFTALFKMGAIFLPVIFALAAPEIRYILKDSQAHTIITDENLYPKIVEASGGLKNIKNILVKTDGPVPSSAFSFDEMAKGNPPTFDMVSVNADDLAVLMYTSGTTGFPKGVMLSHGNISSNVEAGIPAWPTGPEDTMLIPLPLNHIFGLLMVNECNLTGARIVLHKWFEPRLVLQSIMRHKITQFVGVPTMYIRLMETYDPADSQHSIHSPTGLCRGTSEHGNDSLGGVEMGEAFIPGLWPDRNLAHGCPAKGGPASEARLRWTRNRWG